MQPKPSFFEKQQMKRSLTSGPFTLKIAIPTVSRTASGLSNCSGFSSPLKTGVLTPKSIKPKIREQMSSTSLGSNPLMRNIKPLPSFFGQQTLYDDDNSSGSNDDAKSSYASESDSSVDASEKDNTEVMDCFEELTEKDELMTDSTSKESKPNKSKTEPLKFLFFGQTK